MPKMGRPRKEGGRFLHVSINVEPELAVAIVAAARADGDRPVSAFGRMLLTASWRIYKEKGREGDAWLKKHGAPIRWVEGKAARTA